MRSLVYAVCCALCAEAFPTLPTSRLSQQHEIHLNLGHDRQPFTSSAYYQPYKPGQPRLEGILDVSTEGNLTTLINNIAHNKEARESSG